MCSNHPVTGNNPKCSRLQMTNVSLFKFRHSETAQTKFRRVAVMNVTFFKSCMTSLELVLPIARPRMKHRPAMWFVLHATHWVHHFPLMASAFAQDEASTENKSFGDSMSAIADVKASDLWPLNWHVHIWAHCHKPGFDSLSQARFWFFVWPCVAFWVLPCWFQPPKWLQSPWDLGEETFWRSIKNIKNIP